MPRVPLVVLHGAFHGNPVHIGRLMRMAPSMSRELARNALLGKPEPKWLREALWSFIRAAGNDNLRGMSALVEAGWLSLPFGLEHACLALPHAAKAKAVKVVSFLIGVTKGTKDFPVAINRAIYCAAAEGADEVIPVLIRAGDGCHLTASPECGGVGLKVTNLPLHAACVNGRLECARRLIQDGHDPLQLDFFGRTALAAVESAAGELFARALPFDERTPVSLVIDFLRKLEAERA